MKFTARPTRLELFDGPAEFDLTPVLEGVRLQTLDGQFAQSQGAERSWPALWDTGAVISVIPFQFVSEMKLQLAGVTKKPLRGFATAASTGRLPYYYARLALPALPFVDLRVIAPDDSLEPFHQQRRHITLGRDVIIRLVTHTSAAIPLDAEATISTGARWDWRYRRALPAGLADIFRPSPIR